MLLGVAVHAGVSLPSPHVPPVLIAAFVAEVTTPRAAGFLLLMAVTGYLIGVFVGDEYPLLRRRGIALADADRLVEQAVRQLQAGEPVPELPVLLSRITSASDVDTLFADDRIERLLSCLKDASALGDPARRARFEAAYQLLAHLVLHAREDLRIPLAAALGRVLPVHTGLVPHLLEACRRHPDLWNDLQGRFDEAGGREASVARTLEAQAGPDQPWVRRANDLFMNEMERFRRLCEDSDVGMGRIAAPELKAMLAREFTVLQTSAGTSRRFSWLPSNARTVLRLFTPEQVEILFDAVRDGLAGACALASRCVLVWSADGEAEKAEEMVDAMAEAAATHVPAADALFSLLHNIRPTKRHPRLSTVQSALRRRVYDHLQALSKSRYEVRAMLTTQGINNAPYREPTEDEQTLESTAF